MTNNLVHFILGGARSGKSSFAESLAKSSNKQVIYIATAQTLDEEMTQRVDHHKRSRPDHWQTIEQPLSLTKTIQEHAGDDVCILVDCLTLWLNNWLCASTVDAYLKERDDLLSVLQQSSIEGHQILLVSNEVGQGIVPLGKLSRVFVDQAGWLHQAVARIAGRVDFVTAGLNMTLKPQINQLNGDDL